MMQSTEASGALFDAPSDTRSAKGVTPGPATQISRNVGWLRPLAPGRRTLLALLLGLSFAALDGSRAFLDARADITLAADLAAAHMAPRDADAPRPTLASSALSGLPTAVLGSDGTVIASTIADAPEGSLFIAGSMPATLLWARSSLGEGFGAIVVARPVAAITLDVLGRTLAFTLAAALLLLVTVRRRPARAPIPAEAISEPAAPHNPGPVTDWLDDMPYGMARWAADGTLASANATFFRLLRLDPAQVGPGSPYASVSRAIAGKISARPVLDRAHQRIIDVERPDGSAIMLDERECADGGFISTVSDITERRAADRMLATMRAEQRDLAKSYHDAKLRAEAASRAKTTFLAHLSHDIRTPLNHIIGFAELMRLETFGPLGDRRYRDYLVDIKGSGERLLRAFAQILEYAELEGGRTTLKTEPIAIPDLLSRVAARFADTARRNGVYLNFSGAEAVIVSADYQGLERMLGNLLDNAIRFTPRGGEVRLSGWSGPNSVILEVVDTGVGIAEDQLAKLTQPFALADDAFTQTSDGAGLGLAIARTIAELSGGRLEIESRPNTGTTIAIALPLAGTIGQTSAPRMATSEAAKAA